MAVVNELNPDKKTVIRASDFPGNSKNKSSRNSKPSPKVEKEVVKQIVNSKISRKKKPLSKKFAESFFNDDVGNIGEYIIYDVIIPGAKSVIYEIITNSLGMSLFGQVMPQNIKRHGSKSIVNYSGASAHNSINNRRAVSERTRSNHSFDDIVLENKWEAEEVLSMMVEMIDKYDQVTVGDLYDMVGATSSFADQSYGWFNLNTASVRRDRAGYVLVLPRTEVL